MAIAKHIIEHEILGLKGVEELDTRYLKLDASNDPITGNLAFADGIRIDIDQIRARDGDGLGLYDDAGNGIFVRDGGNVGIGTTAPAAKLDVVAGSTAQFQLLNPSANVAQLKAITPVDSSNVHLQYNAYTHQFLYGSNERMRITQTGNVGIGTTAPSTKLHIGTGAMTLEAMTAPSSPASDKAALFLEATGTSPSRTVALKVKWQDGSTSTLASVTV